MCYTWQMCNPKGQIADLISAVKARYHTDAAIGGSSKELTVALYAGTPKKKKEFKQKDYKQKEEIQKGAKIQDRSEKKSFTRKDPTKSTCNNCGQPGHRWRQCPKLVSAMLQKQQGESGKEEEAKASEPAVFMAIDMEESGNLSRKQVWVADTGATNHVTPHRDLLTNHTTYETPKKILTGGKSRFAVGEGEFHYANEKGQGILTEVLYAPGFPTNLFSLDKVVTLGFDIYLNGQKQTVEIMSKKTGNRSWLEKNRKIIADVCAKTTN